MKHGYPSEPNDDQRLDVNNGILLSPTYDAMFDKHLITFENNGKIVLSDSVTYSELTKIGVSGKEKIKNLRADNHIYLEMHQTIFHSKL